jgi:hypothetical protein
MTQILQTLVNDNYAPRKASSALVKSYAPCAQTRDSSGQPDLVEVISGDFKSAGTQTLIDTTESTDNGGIRRTRVFEQEDGRRFSKLEEASFTQNGVRKTVVQQNPSGAITQYEDILDRQQTGGFRRTQRFTNEAGETSTQITTDYTPTDVFTLSGGRSGFLASSATPFQELRGTQLDLSV